MHILSYTVMVYQSFYFATTQAHTTKPAITAGFILVQSGGGRTKFESFLGRSKIFNDVKCMKFNQVGIYLTL